MERRGDPAAMVVMPVSVQRLVSCTRFATLLSWVLWSGLFSLAQANLPDSKKPLWNQDLVPTLSRTQSGLGSGAGVTFFDDTRLIVYAVSTEPKQLSSRESPELSSPFRLDAWVVDAKSGKTEFQKEWGTRRYDSDVRATSGGILVKTGGIVRLYSPDFAQVRELPLPLDPKGSYFASVSTSGRSIAISHYLQKDRKWISHIDVLDASSLKIRHSWDQYPPIFRLSMTDERFVFERSGAIAVTDFAHPNALSILDKAAQGCPAGVSVPTMISSEFVVMRTCDAVLALTASGTRIPLEPFNGRGSSAGSGSKCERYFGAEKSTAASGGRFAALALPTLKIKKPLFAEAGACLDGLQVAVYDLTLRRRVLTVSVDPVPKNNYDFALSPDGSKLVILNDRSVSVYTVPMLASKQTRTPSSKNGSLYVQVSLPPPQTR